MASAPVIRLDTSSPVALYLQIAEELRRLIAFGALLPGDRLPTVRNLAAQTGVNRNTAARAVQYLESRGLVSTRVGRGTFVEQPAEPFDRARREAVVDGAIDRLLVEAFAVGLPLEELGWRLVRRIDHFRKRQEAGARDAARQESGA